MFLALGIMTNQLLRGKGLSTRLDLVEPCSGVAAPGEIVRQHMKHPMKISLEAGSVAKCSTRLSNIGASHLPIAHTVTHGDHPVRPLLLRKTKEMMISHWPSKTIQRQFPASLLDTLDRSS